MSTDKLTNNNTINKQSEQGPGEKKTEKKCSAACITIATTNK